MNSIFIASIGRRLAGDDGVARMCTITAVTASRHGRHDRTAVFHGHGAPLGVGQPVDADRPGPSPVSEPGRAVRGLGVVQDRRRPVERHAHSAGRAPHRRRALGSVVGDDRPCPVAVTHRDLDRRGGRPAHRRPQLPAASRAPARASEPGVLDGCRRREREERSPDHHDVG